MTTERLQTKFADNHHLMNPRRIHCLYPPGRQIREALVARGLWRPMHDELHKYTSPVPLLGYQALVAVASNMQTRYDDIFDGIDDFSMAVEESNRHPKALPRDRELGQHVIECVRDQIPYLREGLTSNRVIV